MATLKNIEAFKEAVIKNTKALEDICTSIEALAPIGSEAYETVTSTFKRAAVEDILEKALELGITQDDIDTILHECRPQSTEIIIVIE